MNLKDFVEKYHNKLVERLEQDLRPVYQPDRTAAPSPKIVSLLRKPFPVQTEIIKGMARAMFDLGRRKLFVCGEMGTGKTTIANSIVHMSPKPLRVLVVSPPHLVEKWKREIALTVPWAKIVDLAVKEAITKLQRLRHALPPEAFEFWVISKERAKLSYRWRPAYLLKKNHEWPFCPSCGKMAVDKEGEPLEIRQLEKKQCKCHHCDSPLWQADRSLKRYAPAEYIKRYLKGKFDMVILDEIHEYKAGDSLQGHAMGMLVSCSKYFLGLTGTLNGGYADDLFYLLYRLSPGHLKTFGWQGVENWQRNYGVLEEVETLDDESHTFGRQKKRNKIIKKRPGVSPEVVGKYFLDKSCFIRLADVVESLPPYDEYVVTMPMSHQQLEYGILETDMAAAVRRNGRRAMAGMLQSLLCYPDSCVVYPEEVPIRDRYGEVCEVITAPMVEIGSDLLQKEKELLRIITEERKKKRKVLVYLVFTGKRDIRKRLIKIIEKKGYRAGILPESIEPKKREKWINDNASDYDVLITNPELVKVGLDLVQFPTIVFFEVGYNIFTLRQAARRSWRIGQKEPVNVYYLCYSGTMQEAALCLTAKKTEVAFMIEGDMPEGLAQYNIGGGSIIEELTNALVEGKPFTGAEAVWSQMRKREIEASLEIGNKETSFTELTKGRKGETTAEKKRETTTVNDDVVINVSVMQKGKRKMSRLSVRYGDLEKELKGKMVQFELF